MANELDPEDNMLTPSPPLDTPTTVDHIVESPQPTLGIPAPSTAVEVDAFEDEVARSQAAELINIRNTNRYELRPSTQVKHVYSTLSIKAARKLYGEELSDKATRDELITCIHPFENVPHAQVAP